ncbi:conserved hypothetical protein [Ricinus communis]|uniref:Uncharacterized protein n=1 Tax=Ricinus communis TaxID=3988 RepID=B9TP83_RICCO|nr:conserved hypothetical protein [Ricinus communis]
MRGAIVAPPAVVEAGSIAMGAAQTLQRDAWQPASGNWRRANPSLPSSGNPLHQMQALAQVR